MPNPSNQATKRAQDLFLWTFVDLDACIRSPYHYHGNRAAGLLNLLLLDSTPLVTQANRPYRLKLRFASPQDAVTGPVFPHVRDWTTRKILEAAFTEDPLSLPVGEESLTLDAFLSHRLALPTGIDVPLSEFISHVASVWGVRHAGEPDTIRRPRDDALFRLRELARGGANSAPLLRVLRRLGFIVQHALSPLFERTNEDLRNGIPMPSFRYDGGQPELVVKNGVRILEVFGHSFRIVTGRYDLADPIAPNRRELVGRYFLDFTLGETTWRQYGPTPLDLDSFSSRIMAGRLMLMMLSPSVERHTRPTSSPTPESK